MWTKPDRKHVLVQMWIALIAGLAFLCWGFFDPVAFRLCFFLLLGFYDYLCIRWIDRNNGWS